MSELLTRAITGGVLVTVVISATAYSGRLPLLFGVYSQFWASKNSSQIKWEAKAH